MKSYKRNHNMQFCERGTMTGKEHLFTFHGTFRLQTLNKLGHYITRSNITFLESRSTIILVYSSMCAAECVRRQRITSFPKCHMRNRLQ